MALPGGSNPRRGPLNSEDAKNAPCEAQLEKTPEGTSESFLTFVDRQINAVERECKDNLACLYLPKNPFFVNANEGFKRIIRTLLDSQPSKHQMVKACEAKEISEYISETISALEVTPSKSKG